MRAVTINASDVSVRHTQLPINGSAFPRTGRRLPSASNRRFSECVSSKTVQKQAKSAGLDQPAAS